MDALIQHHVSLVMQALSNIGYFTEPPKYTAWSLHFDGGMLKKLGFRAAASLQNGVPLIVLPDDFQFPDEFNVLTHEAIHLAQIITGKMVIIPGTDLTEWCGVKYKNIPADSKDYFAGQPWEMEVLEIEQRVNVELHRLIGQQ